MPFMLTYFKKDTILVKLRILKLSTMRLVTLITLLWVALSFSKEEENNKMSSCPLTIPASGEEVKTETASCLQIKAGTILNIHASAFMEFQNNPKWGNILNYMSYYAKSANSLDNDDMGTFYFPLFLDLDDQPPVSIMIDVQKIRYVDDEATPYFIAEKDTIGMPVSWFRWKPTQVFLPFANSRE